jgi:NAD(P)-dependent dehydrogenase (short-subunit alcohol dehydrogenase family)
MVRIMTEQKSSQNVTTSTQDLFRLDGQVAIITGGSGLLALEFAEALADFGASIVLADKNEEECISRATCLSEQKKTKIIGLRCDVTSKDSWEKLVQDVITQFGKLNILVNNAAITNASRSANYSKAFEEFPLEDWTSIMDVNLTGVFLGCQVIGSYLLEQNSGSIVNIASLYGVVSPHHRIYESTGVSQPIGYSVSKAGVIALTRYLGTLWADRGVRVNAITPGGVLDKQDGSFLERYSRLSPTGRMAFPFEMRGALVYLASEASTYCTGHNLIVDGGWTVW